MKRASPLIHEKSGVSRRTRHFRETPLRQMGYSFQLDKGWPVTRP